MIALKLVLEGLGLRAVLNTEVNWMKYAGMLMGMWVLFGGSFELMGKVFDLNRNPDIDLDCRGGHCCRNHRIAFL